eukprot:CAMPEP_0172805818 /NCGR_PEP_ID=MMETSP1075-20121228/5962_1 /TAXON_ID=2916 /ORGANISM="Ceratium fusus, Strain PA161109" /LENGTH=432 /DNA_ID=CAMNT_0013644527 /DNA_START=29 /DNA_END=1327 /DNA_ORIENTATION=+
MEMFIGRIPSDVPGQAITDLFAPYGATDIRVLKAKGCAFATFASLPDAERAINDLNGYQVGSGPGFNVKPADSKGPPQTSNGGQALYVPPPRNPPGMTFAQDQAPEVFIGRLPPSTMLNDVQELLAAHGARDVRLLDGRHCAFATFDSWAAAELVIAELNGVQLGSGGHPDGLNVKFADAKGTPKGTQQDPDPKVFIGGLNSQVTEDWLRGECSSFGQITNCKIFARSAGSPPCAFVTFSSFTEASACIKSLNGTASYLTIEGKVLNARFADATKGVSHQFRMPEPSPLVHARQQHSSTMIGLPAAPTGYPSAPPPASAYGASASPCFGSPSGPGSGDMLPVGGGIGPKLFIGGLPEQANEQFIWGMMSPFGRVAEAKVLRKTGAQSCGFARFAQLGDAEQAMAALSQARFVVKYADEPRAGAKRSVAAAFG